MAPIGRIRPSTSMLSHSSATLPPSNRVIVMPSIETEAFDGGTPMNSATWRPRNVNRAATRSPLSGKSSTVSSTVP